VLALVANTLNKLSAVIGYSIIIKYLADGTLIYYLSYYYSTIKDIILTIIKGT
jgi:hypothetical protein